MYYAVYCSSGNINDGINVSDASMGGNAYDFYAFPTKKERDKWVDENEFNGIDYVAAPVPRRVVEKVMGKYFQVVNNYYGDGLNVVFRKDEY